MTKAERQQEKRWQEERIGAARAIVATGVCPDCGARLRRNSALAGWWQCGRFGVDLFREPEYQGDPTCNFQTFTE